MDNNFQISQSDWEKLQADFQSLQTKFAGHQHLGVGDSLQILPSRSLIGQNNYGLYRKVVLNSTQVQALHTTAQTLVPAPGGTSVTIVDSIEAKLTYNTVAYTGSNNLQFFYTSSSGNKVTADMSYTFLNSSSTAYDHVRGVVTELTPAANAPIVVYVPSANPGAGNSPLTFIIHYRIITF